jgi:6-pyruvoyl-tetrahydropterin synthase
MRATGQIDETGMVIDFFRLEEPMSKILSSMDHKILISRKYAICQGDSIFFETINGSITAPKSSTYMIDIDETTAEQLSSHILSLLLREIGPDADRIQSMEIELLESEGRIGSARISL